MRDNGESNNPQQKPEWSRREVVKLGAAAAMLPLLDRMPALAQPTMSSSAGRHGAGNEWPQYAGDKASTKYSPLDQITAENFSKLKVAWVWRSAEEPVVKANNLKTWVWEATPLMIDGVLYLTTSLSQAAAVDAGTGKTLWVYDPETWKNGTPSNNGFVHRGVSFWTGGEDRRIFFGTGDGYLICLDAKTGKPIRSFGTEGRIDLTQELGRPVDRKLYGVSSPPVICRDVVIMGSKVNDIPLAAKMPPGDVRGFDVRTGKQLWSFHAIPHQGDYGYETWKNGSAERTGAANVWTMMSADDDLGYVYLPLSTPSDDHYGVNPIRLTPDLKTLEDWTSCFRDTDGWQVEFDLLLGGTVEEFDGRRSLMMGWGGVGYNPIRFDENMMHLASFKPLLGGLQIEPLLETMQAGHNRLAPL